VSSTISFPGSDALLSTAPSLTPAGFGALGLANYGASNTSSGSSPSTSGSSSAGASASPSSGVNPYQQTYDNLETAVNAYLQNSLLNSPPAVLPEYTAGTSASSFAQLNTTLASLKQGLGQGLFAGTGFNALA
jgi:hypothetical protein